MVNNRLIIIDGCIGAGKSFLLNVILTILKDLVAVVPENIDGWNEVAGNDVLAEFYAHPNNSKGALNLQILILAGMLKNLTNAISENSDKLIIAERHILSGSEQFAKTLTETSPNDEIDNLPPFDHSSYTGFSNLVKAIISGQKYLVPGLVFYLKTPTKICLQQIAIRGRPGELLIGEKYLSALNQNGMDNLLKQYEDHGTKIHVIDYDASGKYTQVFQIIMEHYGKKFDIISNI